MFCTLVLCLPAVCLGCRMLGQAEYARYEHSAVQSAWIAFFLLVHISTPLLCCKAALIFLAEVDALLKSAAVFFFEQSNIVRPESAC